MHKIKNIEKQLKLNISPIKNFEIISIRKASGRYLADNVYSSINIPPANNSAVDGYLFRFKELRDATTKEFIINSEISAGEMLNDIYSSKIAIKISTGGHIPKGFDAVVMEEDFNIKKNSIILNKKKELFRWMNIRKKAEDIKRNEKVFSAGHLLRAQDVGMLSSLGISKVKVIRKIKVGILSNGNELVEPGKVKLSNKIYDSNRYMLNSLLQNNSILLIDEGIVSDEYKKIKTKLISLKKRCDLVVVSGGASSGSKDYVVKIIKEIGVVKFWKALIKPGRPFGFGLLKNNRPILILPGNPVACFVIFFIFGRKIINYLAGNLSYKPNCFLVKSNFQMNKKIGREEFLRGKSFIKNGKIYVDKFHKQGAGILKSVVWGNGLIRLRSKDSIIKKDSDLEFYPFES